MTIQPISIQPVFNFSSDMSNIISKIQNKIESKTKIKKTREERKLARLIKT